MIQNNMIMNLLMNKLKQQNPQGYNQIQQWISSGANPEQIINQMLANKQISKQQLEQAKNMANQIQNTNQNNNYRRF